MDSIGCGLVGYGLAGRVFHKMLIDAVDGLHVAAVTSRSDEKRRQAAAENPRAAVVDSLDALVAHPSVGLVVLATPHHVHCAEACAALAAGKPVVTDKIMCRSVAEADAMIAAADRAGKLLSVFHNRRWDSDFLTVLQALMQGLLGQVYQVDIAIARPAMPLRPIAEPRWRQTAEAFGGQLVDWGAHLFDQAAILAGTEPDRLFCDLQWHQEGSETESEGFVALHYPSGLRVTITVSVQIWHERPHWYLNGSDGGLELWGIDPQESLMRDRGQVCAGRPEAALPAEAVRLRSLHDTSGFAPVPGCWTAYYENIRDVLRGEAEPAVTAEQCRDVLRVYESCFRAAGVSNATTASRPPGLL